MWDNCSTRNSLWTKQGNGKRSEFFSSLFSFKKKDKQANAAALLNWDPKIDGFESPWEPFICLQKEYLNTSFRAVVKFKVFWGFLLRDIKHYYSLTNLQTYAIALNYFYFKWLEQVSICLLKLMFLIWPSFFLCQTALHHTTKQNLFKDTMPLHLTNGNNVFQISLFFYIQKLNQKR